MTLPDAQLTPHFHAREFACPGPHTPNFDHQLDRRLVERLERLRGLFDEPIRITSGSRCPERNALVGGSVHSQHLTGRAADLVATSFPNRIDDYAAAAVMVGLRAIAYPNHLHVDLGRPGSPALGRAMAGGGPVVWCGGVKTWPREPLL